MSDCCDPGEGCITDFVSGAGGLHGYDFIVENRPFNASGDCCEILCSGFPDVTGARVFDLEYVSIDDGQGCFVENISGTGVVTTPCCNPPCCTSTPTTTCSTGCPDWCTVEGQSYTICSTWVTPTSPTSPTPFPTPTTCWCCYSGFDGVCLPFEWDSSSCKFTGRLFNNDGAGSVFAGLGEVYFNDCLNKWCLYTDWEGCSDQWPGGQRLDATCNGCTGLCACETGLFGDGFSEFLGGGGTGTVCCVRDLCGATLTGSKASDIHGFLSACY